MTLRQIGQNMQNTQVAYWKDVLDQAVDADLSREDFNAARNMLSVDKAQRIQLEMSTEIDPYDQWVEEQLVLDDINEQ